MGLHRYATEKINRNVMYGNGTQEIKTTISQYTYSCGHTHAIWEMYDVDMDTGLTIYLCRYCCVTCPCGISFGVTSQLHPFPKEYCSYDEKLDTRPKAEDELAKAEKDIERFRRYVEATDPVDNPIYQNIATAAGVPVYHRAFDAEHNLLPVQDNVLVPAIDHLNQANQILRNRGYRPDPQPARWTYPYADTAPQEVARVAVPPILYNYTPAQSVWVALDGEGYTTERVQANISLTVEDDHWQVTNIDAITFQPITGTTATLTRVLLYNSPDLTEHAVSSIPLAVPRTVQAGDIPYVNYQFT